MSISASSYKQILAQQLGADYAIPPGELANDKNVFVLRTYDEARRRYTNDGCLLKLLSYNSKLVFSSTDERCLSQCRERFADFDGEWISEFDSLLAIDAISRHFGSCINPFSIHHYYIPYAASCEIKNDVALKWFESDELQQFCGDDRLSEALAFDDTHPDMLAVAAYDIKGNMLGMAGASADSLTMWQIGINVFPDAKNRGIGTYLVWLLKNEILKRGKLPFYGTAHSHIVSQRVAAAAGFVPSFFELSTAAAKDNA